MNYSIIFSIIMIIFLYYINIKFSVTGRKDILFGCIVEDEFKKKEPFKALIKNYKITKTFILVISVLVTITGLFINNEYIPEIGILIYIVLSIVIGVIFNNRVKFLKRNNKFNQESKKEVAVVNLEKQKITIKRIIFYIAITMSFIIFNVYMVIERYPYLPNKIATHFNINGQPNGWMVKSPELILSLTSILFITLIIYVVIDIILQKTHCKINPKNPEESHKANQKTNKILSIMLFITMLPEFISLTIGNLMTLEVVTFNCGIIISLLQGITLIGVIITILVSFKSKNNYNVKNDKVVYKDDDSYWKAGFIYYNKNNSNVFVEKRSGLGVTINAGTTIGMAIYIGIVILIAFTVILPFI